MNTESKKQQIKNSHNRGIRSKMKNAIKQFKNGTLPFNKLQKTIAMTCQKGVIHANKRNRLISRLYKSSQKAAA